MTTIAQIPNSTIAYLIDIGDDTVAAIERAASVQSLRAIGDARAEIALIIDDAAELIGGTLYAWEHDVDAELVSESLTTLREVAQALKTAEEIIRSEQSRFGVNDEAIDDEHKHVRQSVAIAVSEMIEKIQEAR